MKQEVLDYLKTQQVGVLAVEMLDGSPHAATVHFAHTEEPLVFYFETNREYRKAEPLFGREKTRAFFVVGFGEGEMKTLQMDGVVQLLQLDEKAIIDSVYFSKFPKKKEKADGNPKVVFFKFTPNWWRFTDWTALEGKKIWISE